MGLLSIRMRFSRKINELHVGLSRKPESLTVRYFRKAIIACGWLLFYAGLFRSFPGFSQPKIDRDSLQNELKSALLFLTDMQCKTTLQGKEYAGEWPAYMQMHTRFILLGTRRKYRDSNSFTTSGIYNTLSEMYLADTSLKQILPMLQAAYPEIRSYATDERFNFWKLLPPNRKLKKGIGVDSIRLVRRPTHYKLKSRYINNAANVENDADDTASGNLALWYRQRIFGNEKHQVVRALNGAVSDTLPNPPNISPASFQLFDAYTDEQRKNRHWYNYLFNGCAHSGAYMTWLGKEADFKRWNILKTIGHNQIFYLKSSICYPTPFKPYIPYGTNDVDAVVNANILTYLAHKGELALSKGKNGAHRFIQHQAKYRRWSRAGHYYPNRYHFHYAVSRALAAGDTALLATARLMMDHLIKSQQKEGSYRSRRRVNHRDELQSTTYALLALLNFKMAGLNVPQQPLDRAVAFLHRQRQRAENKTYWKGGVFFSGGTVVRNVLYFTSDAYTTALAAQALQKYLALDKKERLLIGRD